MDAIAVVAIAICLFVGSLVGLARSVDSIARARQEVLIRNALRVFEGEVGTRAIGIADWDDAVRNLDNRFDPVWAKQNVGKYFEATYGMDLSFVVDSDNRLVYKTTGSRRPQWSDYSGFLRSAAPLIAKVRARERVRRRSRPSVPRSGNMSVPIQQSGVFRTRAGVFVIVATLVQPDVGKAQIKGARAPILLISQKVDAALLDVIGQRLVIPNLKIAKAGESAILVALDPEGRVKMPLTWTPFRPGREVVAIALLPILGCTLLLLGLYFRGRATAAKLNRIIGELAATRDAAIHANRVKSEFLANMSHELRTPLNAILGFSEMLGSDLFASHRSEYAHIIHRSGAQLLSLVNDLLDLSRIEAGKFALHEETFDFESLIGECVAAFTARCTAKGIRLERPADGSIPYLHADRRALQQILLNLLSNAMKFTPPGKSIRVFVDAACPDGFEFGVCDEGKGIAEEDQAGIFERFGNGRHDLVHNAEGVGLGLPIVKGLVEAHGGSVHLVSRSGAGTRVTVRLPACVAASPGLELAA